MKTSNLLSERMKMIAGLVPPGSRVCDVGCDHAYISVYLADKGIARKVIASDLRPGPLESAKRNIEEYGLDDKIEIRLSDGLKSIGPKETDTILISGMGGELIIRILKEGARTVRNAKRLILSPQSMIPDVREYLKKTGFLITDEDMVFEDGKFYVGILAENSLVIGDTGNEPKDISPEDTELYLNFGECLLKKHDKTLKAFLEHREEVLEKIIKGIEKSGSENGNERKLEIDHELELIRKAGRTYYGM